MSSPEAARWMALWAFELSEFDIRYCPCTAIKGQVVADFITEFTLMEGKGVEVVSQWSIHTDGSLNRQAGGAGVVLRTPEGDKNECMIRLNFLTTNNKAEYETLVVGLDLEKAAGAKNMFVYYNSQIVTSQVNGDYECKNGRMKKYLEEVKGRIDGVQIPTEENECADHLAKAASAECMHVPDQVLSFVQNSPLTDEVTSVQEIGSEKNWTTPLVFYLRDGILPDRKDAARKLKV